LSFEAGQFVRIGLDLNGERIARPFSFVNAPDDPVMEFYGVIVPEGPLSPALARLRPGDPVHIADNPAGWLILSELPPAQELWLVATGTGIAPFLSMLRTAAPWQRYGKVILVHAVRQARQTGVPRGDRSADAPRRKLSYVRLSAAKAWRALEGRIPARRGGWSPRGSGSSDRPGALAIHALRQSPNAQGHAGGAGRARPEKTPPPLTRPDHRGELLVMRLFFIALALTVLQGCSVTRLAYNNADLFLRWQANHYLDFQDDQSEELDRRLAAFLAWHRAKALPQYAQRRGGGRAAPARLKRADLEWSYDAVQARCGALGAAPERGLLDRLSARSATWRNGWQKTTASSRKTDQGRWKSATATREAQLDRLEEWFSPLGRQAERVSATAQRRLAELLDRDRKRRQADSWRCCRARAGQRLKPWCRTGAGRAPEYVQATLATRDEYMDLLLDLDRTLSTEQRQHVVGRLRRFAALFDSLARQP
jgi:hypothetical protein